MKRKISENEKIASYYENKYNEDLGLYILIGSIIVTLIGIIGVIISFSLWNL